jgi:hypothetical protein
MESERLDRAERIGRLISGPTGAVVVLVVALAAFGWFMDQRVLKGIESQQQMIAACEALGDLIRDTIHRNTPEQP